MARGQVSSLNSHKKYLAKRTNDELEIIRLKANASAKRYRKIHGNNPGRNQSICKTLDNRPEAQLVDDERLTSDFILDQINQLNTKLKKYPHNNPYYKKQ